MYFHSYLGKEGLIDLHSFIRPLQQYLLATSPAVPNRRIGVGNAPEKHRSLIVKLLFCFPDALVDCYYWIIQIWKDRKNNRDKVRLQLTLRWFCDGKRMHRLVSKSTAK